MDTQIHYGQRSPSAINYLWPGTFCLFQCHDESWHDIRRAVLSWNQTMVTQGGPARCFVGLPRVVVPSKGALCQLNSSCEKKDASYWLLPLCISAVWAGPPHILLWEQRRLSPGERWTKQEFTKAIRQQSVHGHYNATVCVAWRSHAAAVWRQKLC